MGGQFQRVFLATRSAFYFPVMRESRQRCEHYVGGHYEKLHEKIYKMVTDERRDSAALYGYRVGDVQKAKRSRTRRQKF
jgi:hypothetical protein